MSIQSIPFLVFVGCIICIYYLLEKTDFQKYVLLAASLVCMIAMSDWRATLLIILLSLAVFGIAIRIENLIKKADGRIGRAAKVWFGLGTAVDVGILLYFKFFRFTYILLQNFLSLRNISIADIVVPVGLAYYTLAMYGYLYDVYHKKYKAERSFLLFLTYVTYFPALIEGPINLYKKLAPQLKERHTYDGSRAVMGMQRCLWGYFKKLVIADRIGILVMGILRDDVAAGPIVFYAMVLYSFQIYTDFSGGIDVIMGISEILDIRLTENFRSPLVSGSVTEYWQRWHMSLGEFMEKYLYYPIVLNRKIMKYSRKIPHKYMSRAFSATLASIIVFLIVGIWHGTGWNYVVYGAYQAFFVSTAVVLAPFYKKMKTVCRISDNTFGWKLFTVLRTFAILVLGRVLIKSSDLQQAGELFSRMLSEWNPHALFDGSIYQYGLDIRNVVLMYACILLVIAVDILHERGIHFRELLMQQGIVFRYMVYYAVIFFIIVFGIYGPQFSSSNFIYQAF